MRRREFITLVGTAAMLPLAAHAQRPALPVVGFLSGRSLASDAHLAAAFRQGLSETGHIDGKSVSIEFRWADGQSDRLPALAADLVRRQVAVIFAGAVEVQIRALNAAVATIPTVFATGGDPVELGLGASFNRPGGNATAVTVLTDALWPKRLELLRELSAPATAVALLVNPDRPQSPAAVRELQAAARGIGQSVLVVNVRTEADFDNAFATLEAGKGRRADRRGRRDLPEPTRKTRRAGGAACGAGNLRPARIRRRRRPDELRRQHGRPIPAIRHLRGPDSQGRQARGPAVPAADQVRAHHQPQDRQGARSHCSADHANDRRRGDRVAETIAAAHDRCWHKADMPMAPSNVRFRGNSGHGADRTERPLMTDAVEKGF